MISASGFRRGARVAPLLAVLLLVVAACAGGSGGSGAMAIPSLEREVASSPQDGGLKLRLGIAQFEAGDHEAARATLLQAMRQGSDLGPTLLYLGMACEELEDWSAARDAYGRYLAAATSSPARTEVRNRLTLVGRNLLRARSGQALMMEDEPGVPRPSGTTGSVAVIPFGIGSGRALEGPEGAFDAVALEALSHALAEMMVTDFVASRSVVAIERARTQSLLDAMALGPTRYGDRETAMRVGRMLGATTVLYGEMTARSGGELRLVAELVEISTGSTVGPIIASASAASLVELEKDLVVRMTREALRQQLSPSRERGIRSSRPSTVAGLVAFGRGLRSMDGGRYDAALAWFADARDEGASGLASLDAVVAEATAMAAASRTTTADLAALAGETGETGRGLLGPPSATTTDDMTSVGVANARPVGAASTTDGSAPPVRVGTLWSLAEGVDPGPATTTLGLSSAEESRHPTSEQSRPTSRDPLQEALGAEILPGSEAAQLRIVIQRPGGGS